MDERVANAILNVVNVDDDPEIVFDLRRANGKLNSTIFGKFWDELQAYFDEMTCS